MFPPKKRFDIVSSPVCLMSGGCSEGFDAFRLFFKHSLPKELDCNNNSRYPSAEKATSSIKFRVHYYQYL